VQARQVDQARVRRHADVPARHQLHRVWPPGVACWIERIGFARWRRIGAWQGGRFGERNRSARAGGARRAGVRCARQGRHSTAPSAASLACPGRSCAGHVIRKV
jgi:hypothetical protein